MLATNIINEKIFVFLWFWLIFLAVITILYLIYVGAIISIPSLRRVMVERNAKHPEVKVSGLKMLIDSAVIQTYNSTIADLQKFQPFLKFAEMLQQKLYAFLL